MKQYCTLRKAKIAATILAAIVILIMYFIPPKKNWNIEQLIISFTSILPLQILAIVQQVGDKKSKELSTAFVAVSILADFILVVAIFFSIAIVWLNAGEYMQKTIYSYILLALILLIIALYVTKYKLKKS